mmetsp:Transcript_14882/g.29726  ORF Transcript_14882/g.29726 Transcript_14882/m.29726 type:complete len:207 (+) Transcript_14882:245-865(+)
MSCRRLCWGRLEYTAWTLPHAGPCLPHRRMLTAAQLMTRPRSGVGSAPCGPRLSDRGSGLSSSPAASWPPPTPGRGSPSSPSRAGPPRAGVCPNHLWTPSPLSTWPPRHSSASLVRSCCDTAASGRPPSPPRRSTLRGRRRGMRGQTTTPVSMRERSCVQWRGRLLRQCPRPRQRHGPGATAGQWPRPPPWRVGTSASRRGSGTST